MILKENVWYDGGDIIKAVIDGTVKVNQRFDAYTDENDTTKNSGCGMIYKGSTYSYFCYSEPNNPCGNEGVSIAFLMGKKFKLYSPLVSFKEASKSGKNIRYKYVSGVVRLEQTNFLPLRTTLKNVANIICMDADVANILSSRCWIVEGTE